MKKLQLVLLVLISAAFFMSCENSKGVTNPDDMGKYAFDMLKEFDNATKNSYINSIFTIEEIKDFGERNAETLAPKAKEDIDRLEKHEYDDRMGRDYNRTKDRAKEAGISWNAIEYAGYEFKELDEEGLKGIRGTLSFTHNDKTYTTKIVGVLIEGTYKLVRIYSLNTADE